MLSALVRWLTPLLESTLVGTRRGSAGVPYTPISLPVAGFVGFGPAHSSKPPFGTYTRLSPPKMNCTPGSFGSQLPPGSVADGTRGKLGRVDAVTRTCTPSRRAVAKGVVFWNPGRLTL